MAVVIAVSGAHGSGKSTLTYQIAGALKVNNWSVGIVSEAARSSHYLMSGNRGPEMHLEVFSLHVLREIRAARIYQIVVCDRSIFDFLAYAYVRFPRDSYATKAMAAFGTHYRGTYNLILKTTASYGNADRDVIRATEHTMAADMDAALTGIYTDFGIPYLSLPKQDALEVAMSAIVPILHRGR